MNCLSFNTNCEQIVMQGRDAAAFLDELEASAGPDGGLSSMSGIPANIAITSLSSPVDMSMNQSMDTDDSPSAQETSASGSTSDAQSRPYSYHL